MRSEELRYRLLRELQAKPTASQRGLARLTVAFLQYRLAEYQSIARELAELRAEAALLPAPGVSLSGDERLPATARHPADRPDRAFVRRTEPASC